MLLVRSPVVLALSLYAALVFGDIYILFTTFNGVFRGQYGFSSSVSGLVYLGLGIALVLGVVIFGNINPRIQAARMKADGVSTPKPEYRLLLMVWLSPCVAVGLFLYGWTTQYKVHWVVPIIGTFFIGFGAYFVLVGQGGECAWVQLLTALDAHPAVPHRAVWLQRGCLGAQCEQRAAIHGRHISAVGGAPAVCITRLWVGKYAVGVSGIAVRHPSGAVVPIRGATAGEGGRGVVDWCHAGVL